MSTANIRRIGKRLTNSLDDGLYKICELGVRRFLLVAGSHHQVLDQASALEIIHVQEEAKQKVEEEIDGRIARFNSEGGFTFGEVQKDHPN